MVTARTVAVVALLALGSSHCAATVTEGDASRSDEGADDVTVGSDVTSDMGGVGRPPTCAGSHFYIDLEQEDGSRIEECLALQDLVWTTSYCRGRSFSADGRAITADLRVGAHWGESSPPEPFPFSTAREYRFFGAISMANARCRGRCERVPPLDQCCTYSTGRGPHCRWALRRAGALGEEIEAELVAPCTLVFSGLPEDDTRRITLRRARFRGTIRHHDMGVALPHDVYEVFDCGY